MKEPLSEYEDCMKQFDESYDEYSQTREQIQEKENTPASTSESGND